MKQIFASLTFLLLSLPAWSSSQVALEVDFTLEGVNGPVQLNEFKGKGVAIYFGYLSCPDVCPTSMMNLQMALKKLPKDRAAQVQGILVSVDPDRDTVERTDKYAKGFNKSFIGLTADNATVEKESRKFGVLYEKVAMPNSAMGYAVDHSSVIYMVDKQGYLKHYPDHTTSTETLVEYLMDITN